MLAISDLYLLRNNLRELKDTAYFNSRLEKYAQGLIAFIDHVLKTKNNYPDQVVREFSAFVWGAHQYLAGSVTKEIPYELEFALSEALNGWLKEDAAITTALLSDLSFHFQPLDPWGQIQTLISDFQYPEFNSLLIQIALPRLYKDKPLFNIPLYHELGHFIDEKFQVSAFATILNHSNEKPDTPEIKKEHRHRREFFADLFASCYVGEASCRLLNEFAPDAKETDTHPSTAVRMLTVSDFIAFRPNEEVSLLQHALGLLQLPALEVRFKKPDGLAQAFDDLRPYKIANNEELHGMFEGGLEYLLKIREAPQGPWIGMSPAEIDATVNDLVEKSIRNLSIVRKWNNAASQQATNK